MIEKICDVAVIGGGPAGISAATTVAQQGASAILVNSSNALGGNFYKQLPNNFDDSTSTNNRKNIQEFQERVSLLQKSQAEIINQALVWGIFQETEPGFQIYAEHPEHNTINLTAQTIIMAPGVYDRCLPFPGWELPGVMTPGAVQMALKEQGLVPGKRVLVCGTGPLQMIVAAALVEDGVEVVAMLDTSGAFDGMRDLLGAFYSLKSRLGEIFHSLETLLRHRVPILFHHAAFRALGHAESGVTGAVIGKVGPNGHPIPGTERNLKVDTICCAYGFMPSIALTLHLGCKHVYAPQLGVYIPWHDEHMQTSLPDVFVAGDVTGVGGKTLAELQGKLAGISALSQLGILSKDAANQQRRQLDSAVRREERFSRWLWNRYRFREGLLDLADDNTLICLCENVTAGDIKQSLDQGARNLYGVKLRTRMGMGSCQGRYCMMNTAELISQQTGYPVHEIGTPSVRPPLAPTRLRNIAAK